jgi:predicted TPR repeat methyltransferase
MKKASKRRRKPPPSDPVELLHRAIRLLEADDFEEAQTLCSRALARHPDWPQALHVMGIIAFKRNQPQRAVDLLRKAIDSDPDYVLAYNDLGNILHEMGELTQAIAAFSRLLELTPDDSRVLNNLGVVLKDNQQFEESIVALRKAVEIDPEYFNAHVNLSWTYQKLDNFTAAIASMERAASLNPQDVQPIRALTWLYRLVEDREKVAQAYERWLALEPDSPIARHMLLANSSIDLPGRAPDDYVRAEFDRFADSFDDKLQSLNYRAPHLVADLVEQRIPNPTQSLVILDAGCGTGLSGVLLRPYAQRLVGVDLSAKMLEKAELRAVYDELLEREIGEYLSQQTKTFDLITVVDTFVYFGELLSPLTNCAAALRDDGALCFTLEALSSESNADYRLSGSGRYQHSRRYVELCLVQAGFNDFQIAKVVLREEQDRPVAGYLVWAPLRSTGGP